MSQRIWMNGRLVPADQAAVSVFDHGLLYGDGVFEGIRIYNGRIFKLRTHLLRLFASAKVIRLPIPYSLEALDAAVRETVAANEKLNGYVRLCVTRGSGTLGLNPFKCSDPTAFIIADSISLYPRELYETGMAVITAATMRNHPLALSPRVKSMNYLNNIMAKIEALDAGANEAVMLNHQGYVAECTGDNLFVVHHAAKGSSLATPPLHAGVLEGVTRGVVMDLAREMGMPVTCPDMTRHDLYVADEIFLTGTAAEVIAVTRVDNRPIGTGKPGAATARLTQAFRSFVENDAPED
ncbi:MAG: branched-chain-amino-acid transaminase [Phycisphaeraceae bacterium]